jgi:hypothetical protein
VTDQQRGQRLGRIEVLGSYLAGRSRLVVSRGADFELVLVEQDQSDGLQAAKPVSPGG